MADHSNDIPALISISPQSGTLSTGGSIAVSTSVVNGNQSSGIYVIVVPSGESTPLWSHLYDTNDAEQSGDAWSFTIDDADLAAIASAAIVAGYTMPVSIYVEWQMDFGADGRSHIKGAWPHGRYNLYDPPTVAVTSPANGSTISSMPLTIAWTATDSVAGISAQHVALAKGASTVWEADLEPAITSVQLTPADVQLDTGSTYAVAVTARNGVGIEGSATASFSVSWTRPAAPSASITNTTSSAQITVTAGAGGAATDHIMIERSDSRGVAVIADNLSSGSTFYDVIAPLGKECKYFVYAVSALGATRTTTVTNTIPSTSWALTWRNGASTQTQLLKWNPQASYTMGHGGELYHFADGGEGGGLPVWYGTTDRDESGTLKFDTILNTDADALRAAVMAHPVMWLRDPFGHRWRAHVTLSYTHGVGQLWPVTLAWDAVRFEEV